MRIHITLAVKLEHTGLASHLDLLLSTHTFGYPKEDQRLWRAVTEETGISAEKTLFIDDSETDSRRRRPVWYSLLSWRDESRFRPGGKALYAPSVPERLPPSDPLADVKETP